MNEVVCVTQHDNKENPFWLIYSYLDSEFDTKLIRIGQEDTLNPKIIVTDSVQALSLSKRCKTILYISTSDPWLDKNIQLRRQLQVRQEIEFFCASMYLARIVYSNYQIKAKVQYPYIYPCPESSEPLDIMFNEDTFITRALQDEFPLEQFRRYENRGDFASAKLYVHIPSHNEVVNVHIPLAASWGVPCVTVDQGCITEITSRGDLILPPNANLKQWIQGVKTAMRDRDNNSRLAKDGSKKFSNLDMLVEKVKMEAQQRSIKKLAAVQNVSPKTIKENILANREVQAVHKRTLREKKKLAPAPLPAKVVVMAREPYIIPKVSRVESPNWFRKIPEEKKVDVSIIIPMYRSVNEISEQIAKWDLTDDGLTKEVIYVDDCCPQKSYNAVILAWEKRRPMEPIGEIYLSDINAGFSTACNEGAKHARGECLVFLNADTVVTPNWVRPMYSIIKENEDVGIVGNLQLKTGDVIDSAGSEWFWDNKMFEHVGRNVYKGKRLGRVMTLKDAPTDLLQPAERDMVTGCCFMMPKKLFEEVGGFDISYRIGYWEDSDINMEVKSRGYKVYYQPKSVIYHKSGHSRAGLHPFIMDNARRFYEKWVDNHRIDSLVATKRP